jgi:hypothetical protein
MSTDKKLLELAAKAAGYSVEYADDAGLLPYALPSGKDWNPLTDDGDALRLAVKLDMDIVFDFDRVMVVFGNGDGTCITEYFYELPNPTDRYAVTRRAIVRAAAEIGKL